MHSSNNKRLIILVFSFFLIINITSSGGHFDWWDGIETFLVTESMVLKHSAKLHPDIPSIEKLYFDIRKAVFSNKAIQTGQPYNENISLDPYYTVRSLMLSAIAVPFYYAAMIFSVSPISFVALSVTSLLISLISVVIFCFSLDIYGSRKIAFVLSLIFTVCSFVWPYHTSLWVQPLQALCIITAAYFLYLSLHYHSSFICYFTREDKNNRNGIYFSAIGGLFLGLSVFAHPTSVIVIPGFVAYGIFCMRHNRGILSSFLVVLTIMLILMGIINYWRFGSVTEFGYGYYGSLSTHGGWRGLVGLIVSPGVGLIFYFPISILLPIAFRYMYRTDKRLFYLSAYIIIVNWLYVGTLSYWEPFAWTGGIAWGPRYLIPILPFMTIVFGSLLKHLTRRPFLKAAVIGLSIAGFCINLAGSLVWYNYGFAYGWQIEQLWDDPNHIEIMTWNPYYSPIILHMKALINDYVSTINPEKYLHTYWTWTSYGLAPCSYDVYFFCKFGIIPILVLSAIITILAFAIMNSITSSNHLSSIILRNYISTKRATTTTATKP